MAGRGGGGGERKVNMEGGGGCIFPLLAALKSVKSSQVGRSSTEKRIRGLVTLCYRLTNGRQVKQAELDTGSPPRA